MIRFSVILVAGFTLLSPPVAAHAQSADLIARLLACRSLGDDALRLTCMDAATATLVPENNRTAKPIEPTGDFGLQITKPVIQEEDFGAESVEKPKQAKREREKSDRKDEDRSLDEDGNLRSIRSGVLESGSNRFGKTIFVLENGQVWRQLDSEGKTMRIPKNVDAHVTIKKSGFGGYFLTVDELNRSTRVRRIK